MVSWKRLVDEALDPTLDAKGSTLIVQNHLAQMKMFVHRGGVEFYPAQDDQFQSRKKFIQAEARFNKLPLKIDRAVDVLAGRGELLLYFRPTQNGRYKLHLYEKGQYKAYYDNDGDLQKVVIVYSYEIEKGSINVGMNGTLGNTRWLRLTVTTESIVREDFASKPGFTDEFVSAAASFGGKQEYINSLRFLPCVIVKNYFGDDGREGLSDFYPIRRQLENHDDLIRSLNTNLKFFGNSTFVTSRSAREVLQAFSGDPKSIRFNDSLASRSGFQDFNGFSSYGAAPINSSDGEEDQRIARIIDNIAPDERAGYITPDAITADHAAHAREERESIHFALGGIDELGVSANATAYEMKTIYGKLAVTASKKARALFDYGLCIVFEMMIAAEEDLFRQSLSLALNLPQEEVTDGLIQQLMENNKLPAQGVFGLPPMGDRQVEWRYTGEVFEKSPRDLMDESIVVRNLQELGMAGPDALKATNLFENKTHAEIEEILSKGYPYRYVQSVLGATQTFISMYAQMLNLPDLQHLMQTGQQRPLAAMFPVDQFMMRGLQTIQNELNYQEEYNNVMPGDPPEYNLGISQFNSYLANQNESSSVSNPSATPGTVQPTGSYGFSGSPSLSPFGVQPPGISTGSPSIPVPDYLSELPTPDTVIAVGSTVGNQQPYQFGPMAAGHVPLTQPTVEPIPDDRTNADRTTRKPKQRKRR